MCVFFFFKQKTAYEMRISDWSSDVCSSDLRSGISDKNGYFTLDALNPQKDPNWKKAYNNYAPGADYQYCNLNFNLAGAILEKYSGERLDHYVEKHILKPLDLYGGYNVYDLDITRFVTLYASDGKARQFNLSPAAYRSRPEALKDYQMADRKRIGHDNRWAI